MTLKSSSQLFIQPIDQLIIAENLDGSQGLFRNKNPNTQMIDANNDLQAIHSWLNEFSDSPHTQRAYKKEAERILLWSLIELGKPLSSLSRDDTQLYLIFLKDPQPAERWIGPKAQKKAESWRPFSGPLSESSQRQAIATLQSLFRYLYESHYTSTNPFSLTRLQSINQDNGPIDTYFNETLWNALLSFADELPENKRKARAEKVRINFMLRLFYYTAARISELCSAKMSDLSQHRSQWWLSLKGKGRRIERIPVSVELLDAISRYREFHHLPSYPHQHEQAPLIMALYKPTPLTSSMVYKILCHFFSKAAHEIDHLSNQQREKLRNASPHWIRHSAITRLTDGGVEQRYIQKFARHRNANTTSRYQHIDDNNWHNAISMISRK